MKKNLLAMVAVALLAGPMAASAVPVTYDFTVNGGASGPLAGVTSSGFFTYDDSIGVGPIPQTGLILDLAFTWNGVAYDETSANTGGLVLDSTGLLTGGCFGTYTDVFAGTGICAATVAHLDSWYISLNSGDLGQFVYNAGAQSGGLYTGSVSFARRVATSVPEPGTLALFGLSLIGLVFVRRRRATN